MEKHFQNKIDRNNTLRILLVDDHLLFAKTLHSVFSPDSDVTICQLGMDGLMQIVNNKYDVVLLDINLPDIDGCKILNLIQKLKQPPPVLILSGENNAQVVRDLKQSGAKGFCHKSISPEVLVQAIEAVTSGSEWWMETSQSDQTDSHNACLKVAERVGITGRQLEILELLNQGYYNKLIADKLNIAESTVKTHIAALYRILGVHTRTSCLHAARKIGLIEN